MGKTLGYDTLHFEFEGGPARTRCRITLETQGPEPRTAGNHMALMHSTKPHKSAKKRLTLATGEGQGEDQALAQACYRLYTKTRRQLRLG